MRAKKLADEHWEWLGPLFELIYKGAFVHGYKHKEEDDESKDLA